MTVRQLLRSMDSAELTEWMAFDRIEPFGDPRADLRAGIVASSVANFSMVQLPRSMSPADFMPFLGTESGGPTLLPDPEAQSRLLVQTLFGGVSQ